MGQAKVSVIVPAYNSKNYINACVDSLLAQTYPSVEIIVVNDGSTDETRDILLSYGDKIRLIDQENQGVSTARNHGLSEATGDYLLFVDSDDFIDANYIEKMVKAAVKYNSDLVLSGYIITDATGKAVQRVIPGDYVAGVDEIWAYRLSSVWSRIYKRKYWDENKLHFVEEEGARGEDIPIAMFTNATAKNIRVLNYAGYNYRQHRTSAMNAALNTGKTFGFPYVAMEEVRSRMTEDRFVNSREYYAIGWLKALAHFEYVLFKNADAKDKKKYEEYVTRVLIESFPDMDKIWSQHFAHITLPLKHKVAMWMLLRKYTKYAG